MDFTSRRAAGLPAGSRRAAAALRVLAGQAGTGVEMVLGLRNASHCANPQDLYSPLVESQPIWVAALIFFFPAQLAFLAKNLQFHQTGLQLSNPARTLAGSQNRIDDYPP